MKSVLITIRPKWCELIASGKKTVEVRKTTPKLKTPFKCYIYCTKDNTFAEKTLRGFDDNGNAIYYKANKGKVIGEFVCDKIYNILPHYDLPNFCNSYECDWLLGNDKACLSFDEFDNYLKGKNGYGWHITDLVVYDKSKNLSEFELTRPPQSWCYLGEFSTPF